MFYQRVIPRDLFNEANLLKCYGRLWLLLEPRMEGSRLTVQFTFSGAAFDVEQNPADGSLSIDNVELWIRGVRCSLYRPVNSRSTWPLYLAYSVGGQDDIPVFDDDGNLSEEMLKLLDTEKT